MGAASLRTRGTGIDGRPDEWMAKADLVTEEHEALGDRVDRLLHLKS